jgi:hypothetical protein
MGRVRAVSTAGGLAGRHASKARKRSTIHHQAAAECSPQPQPGPPPHAHPTTWHRAVLQVQPAPVLPRHHPAGRQGEAIGAGPVARLATGLARVEEIIPPLHRVGAGQRTPPGLLPVLWLEVLVL